MTKQFKLALRDLKALRSILDLALSDTDFLNKNFVSTAQELHWRSLRQRMGNWVEEEQNEIAT